MFDIVKQRYLSRDSFVGFGKPSLPKCSFAWWILLIGLLQISCCRCRLELAWWVIHLSKTESAVCVTHFLYNLLENMDFEWIYLDLPGQEQETPLPILPSPARTINDLPTDGSIYLDLPLQETPLAIRPACTINDLPTGKSIYLDLLPTEILDRILEYFQDDLSSLKTFSLISRPFLSICRKRLFSTLCLNSSTLRLNSLGSSFDYQCDRWMFFVKYSTEFMASLRILELGPAVLRYHTRDKVYSDHWIQIVDQGVPSIHDQRVQTIIQHALNPQTLILRFEFQAWKNFLPTFQNTVIELIQRGTVSSLSLEDVVDFPIVALSGCRYLRELSLVSFHISDPDEGPGSSGDEVLEETKGYLESLTLFASDQYVKKLINVLSLPCSLLDLTKLRRLSINLTGSDGRLAIENIPLVARGITNLELRSGENGMYPLTIYYPIKKSKMKYTNQKTVFLLQSGLRYMQPTQLSQSTFLADQHFLQPS